MAGPKSNTKPLRTAVVEAARPEANPYELSDAASGLRLNVSPTGVKSWRWYVKDKGTGKTRKVTLGTFPAMSLGAARTKLGDLKDAHAAGTLSTVVESHRKPKVPEGPAGVLTVKKAADDFLASLDRKRPEQARRAFDVDVIPVIGAMPVKAVTSDDVRRVVKRKVDDKSPVMARHVLALLKQFFDWAVDENLIDASPAARFKKKKALGTRKADTSKRYLSPKEIPVFWKALGTFTGITPTVKGALRLLLLLGVRTGELRQATWDAVDLDKATLTVPPEHQKLTLDREKKAKPWVVPLPPTAVAILSDLRVLAASIGPEGSKYVLASFAGRGEPVSEKALNHAMRRMQSGKAPALKLDGERPTPHDLRRTVRTHLEATLRVPEAICERVLNHSRGTIVDTYAHGDYLDARREALGAWDAYVERLVTGKGAEVVAINVQAVRS